MFVGISGLFLNGPDANFSSSLTAVVAKSMLMSVPVCPGRPSAASPKCIIHLLLIAACASRIALPLVTDPNIDAKFNLKMPDACHNLNVRDAGPHVEILCESCLPMNIQLTNLVATTKNPQPVLSAGL